MLITNKHFSKIEKKTLQTNIAVKVCVSLDCVGLTLASVVQIIYHNVGLKCFFIYLIFVIIVSFSLHLYLTW